MKAELKKRWVEALRSGKYKQGKGKLCVDGKFCCLGVLLDVMGKQWTASPGSFDNAKKMSGTTSSNYLDDDLLREAGLSGGWQMRLASLNDNDRDFLSIAAIIEADLPASVPEEEDFRTYE